VPFAIPLAKILNQFQKQDETSVACFARIIHVFWGISFCGMNSFFIRDKFISLSPNCMNMHPVFRFSRQAKIVF